MLILPVSLTAVLVELADRDETLALFASLTAEPVDGIEDMVPAARTLMIRFRPDAINASDLARVLQTRDLSAAPPATGQLVEIPVRYDGEDLEDVAELIRRHTESEFAVAFCGFAPGFGYLVGGDPALHVPRRQTPSPRWHSALGNLSRYCQADCRRKAGRRRRRASRIRLPVRAGIICSSRTRRRACLDGT